MADFHLPFATELFAEIESLRSPHDSLGSSVGLGTIGQQSPLKRDDATMNGFWTSTIATNSINAALDHIVMFEKLMTHRTPELTANAPWTLLRGAMESSATALWVMAPKERRERRLRTLRIWVDEGLQRKRWEEDTGVRLAGNSSGLRWMAKVILTGRQLGIPKNKICRGLKHLEAIQKAAIDAGLDPYETSARWREASGFAHGRAWATIWLSELAVAGVVEGGMTVRNTLDDKRLSLLGIATTTILKRSIDRWAELSDDVQDMVPDTAG